MFYKPQLCQVLIRTHTYSHIHCTYKVNWATRQTNTHIHMQPVTARLFGSLADSWPLAKRQCATNYAVGLLRSLWPRSLLMQRPPTLQHLVTDKYLCQCLCVRSSIHLQMHACKHAAFYCSQFTERPVKFPLVPMKYTHTQPGTMSYTYTNECTKYSHCVSRTFGGKLFLIWYSVVGVVVASLGWWWTVLQLN